MSFSFYGSSSVFSFVMPTQPLQLPQQPLQPPPHCPLRSLRSWLRTIKKTMIANAVIMITSPIYLSILSSRSSGIMTQTVTTLF